MHISHRLGGSENPLVVGIINLRRHMRKIEGKKSMEFSKDDPNAGVPKVKVVVLGNNGVGKSSIVHRLITGEFNKFGATLGVDTRMKIVESNGTKIRMEIWDTAGQEKYRSMIRSFFKNAKAVILVFDLTNLSSLHTLKDWIKEVDTDASTNIPKIILGNKADLKPSRIPAETVAETIQQLTKSASSVLSYDEVSALTGENIQESFQTLASELISTKSVGHKPEGVLLSQKLDPRAQAERDKVKKGQNPCC
jgi:small GTP-binding protein